MARENNPIGEGAARRQDDEMIPDGIGVIEAINQCRRESEDARSSRESKGNRNWELYLGRQDWSHKQEGQSREFLPKVPISVERLGAIIKKGLVGFGDYFSVDTDAELGQLITGSQIREILKCFLGDLWNHGGAPMDFPTVVSDGVKQALLKSLIILKTHGGYINKKKFNFERGETLKEIESQEFKLRIDLIRFEDYYPDPTGNNLYEIHRVERDLHEVVAMSEGEDPIYDKAMVQELIGTTQERAEDEKLSEADRNQNEATPPAFRKRVVIDEFWGTLLKNDGTVHMENVVAAVANDRFLIRKPEPNPFWHQKSPFNVAPLIRVPHSVFHKAIYDHASDLNIAINELYNLIIDGGMASVWGISQLRIEDLEDPAQVEGGIRQGMTLAVKNTLPHNAKVYERVSEGKAPVEASVVFESLEREFHQAAMTSETGVGSLPPKQVLATEVIAADSGSNSMLEGVITDVENICIGPVLEKAFWLIMQMADKMPEEAFSFIDDKKVAMMIMRASPEERFSLFYGRCKFKVFGLSATMSRAIDFQKIMAFVQATSTNPMFLQSFLKKYSPDKFMDRMMICLNLNPKEFERSQEEVEGMPDEMNAIGGAQQLLGGGPQNAEGQPAGVAAGPAAGGSPETAAIQRRAQPGAQLPENA